MKCHPPRLLFSSKWSLHAKNSENREWSSSVHTQRPDRNNRGYQAASTTARRRDLWAAADFGFEGRDARQPGCRRISPPLRGRWHQARKLPPPCPKVDRSSKRSTQVAEGICAGLFRSGLVVAPLAYAQLQVLEQAIRAVGSTDDAALSDYTPRLCPRIRRHDGRVERPQERTGTHTRHRTYATI
jgi:hypothetical protein